MSAVNVLAALLVKNAQVPRYEMRPSPNDPSQMVPFENDRGFQRWASPEEYALYQKLQARQRAKAVPTQEQFAVPSTDPKHLWASQNPVRYGQGSVFDNDNQPRVFDRHNVTPVEQEEFDRMGRIYAAVGRRRQQQYDRQQRDNALAYQTRLTQENERMRSQLSQSDAARQQQAGQMAYYASRDLKVPAWLSGAAQQAGGAVAKAITPWFQRQAGVTSNRPLRGTRTQGISSNIKPGAGPAAGQS